jgi:pre-mRNA-splicing factor 38A
LNSALVLEKAVDDLKYIGGTYGGNTKPTPFLCLSLKLLQIQPQKEIIHLYIDQPDFKYLRALGAFYLRLVGRPAEIYIKLEPILRDYRKLRISDRNHKFSVIHMDELIDNLLREERVFDIILPRMTKRFVLEENGDLEPYKSEVDLNIIPTQAIHEKVEIDRKHVSGHHSRDLDDHRNYKGYSSRDSREYRSGHKRPKYSSGDYDKSTTGKIGRFRKEDVDNENNIRAKLGLKPLK